MSRFFRLTAPVLLLCAGSALAADETVSSNALLPQIDQYHIPMTIESGPVSAAAADPLERADLGHQVIFSAEVDVPGASALRMIFDTATLDADSYLRITSQLDGHVQTLRAEHLAQWAYTSAYFNGDVVSVEILAAPGSGPAELAISEVIAEFPQNPDRSICGTTDDRVLASDNRSGRIWPIGCTAWQFDGRSNCLNTAGHCGPVGSDVIQFNVPLSSAGGTPQHPGPDDQYSVDPASIQSNGGLGIGNDWATFGVFDNPGTGLSPLAANGAGSYTLAAAAPAGGTNTIRITGFGSTTSPVSPTWYLVNKTHTGPYDGLFSGTNITYATDTTGGNSGSAVEDITSGFTIGVHTHAGCSSAGGANNGTAVQHAAWQDALNNPLGICDFGLNFDFVLGNPDFIDPNGATSLTVEVTADAGVLLNPSSVELTYDDAFSTVVIPMTNSGGDNWVATFPGGVCGETASYFVSADTAGGDPYQSSSQNAPIATSLDTYANFDFETDPFWSVTDTAISTGTWERAIPRAEGRGDPLSDYDGSGQCWVTDNGLSADVDGGPTVLTTASVDLSGSTDPIVSYARWHDTNDPGVDNLVVQFSDNAGSTWTTVETITATTGWVEASHRVADHVSLTSQFQVRWSVSDNPNASVTESAVDAFRVIDVVCGAACSFADCDANGTINIDDIDCFVAGFLAGDLSIADCDANGTINIDDIDCFVASFLAGCP